MDKRAGRKRWADALSLVGKDGGDARVVGGWLREVGRVRDDEDVVFGDGEIEFEGVGTDIDAMLEGGDGVLGAGCASSAMGVDEDGLGGCGEGCYEK